MSKIVLLPICLLIGIALRRWRRLPDNAPEILNGYIIYVALPALVLQYVHGARLGPDLIAAVLMPWLLFALGAGFFWLTARALKLPRGSAGVLTIVGGLGNTSFVGLPMIASFYGNDHLSTGILIDQLGTYLVLGTLGIAVICTATSRAASPREIALRIFAFPPFLALLLALALIPVPLPGWVISPLQRLGDTMAPLALVSIGLQLRAGLPSGRIPAVTVALAWKLLLGPAVIALIYFGLVGGDRDMLRVTVFEAAMPPQIGASIVAIQYGMDRDLITLVVAAGTVLAFATLPLWYQVLAAI